MLAELHQTSSLLTGARAKPDSRFLRRGIGSSLLFVLILALARPLFAAAAPDIEEQTREIAAELRCVVCQNLSVADSPSEMAQQMRAVVREQLEAGKTPEQVREFFVSKYGEWVLLKPKTTGLSALLWILPYVVLIVGVIAALGLARRWAAAKKSRAQGVAASGSNEVGSEFLTESFARPHLEDSSPRAALLRERARLQDELNELDFDFQSGKLSGSDHAALKLAIETKAAAIFAQMQLLSPEIPSQSSKREPSASRSTKPARAERPGVRRWQLVAGAVFLVGFGLSLGVMLTQSVRPRLSESDTMTGDFLTGTGSSNSTARAALAEGKTAFAHQEFPKAIEAFKKVLSADPDNPEAHSYMGYILLQAGHGDGALMAFDKALSQAPNLPMALWGKGMALYQNKEFTAARGIFEKLLSLVPPGEERNEIAKVLAEMPASGAPKDSAVAAAPKAPSTTKAQISGKITIDPKLKTKVDPSAALFIIARSAGAAAGPPLAVKKIERPAFPVDYTLSQENVMMQGMPFAGKITVLVRLDKDGNPVTRGAGDLTGDYKNNPVEVGAKNVDIVIDQLTQ